MFNFFLLSSSHSCVSQFLQYVPVDICISSSRSVHELAIYAVGLDAFQAEKVMETLRQLAEDGHTVICSIHQPRGSVYSKFDDIVLLSEGSVVYMGPAKEEPLTYFATFGL